MAEVASEGTLLTLHNADAAGEWSKRGVRAEFHNSQLVLHSVEGDVPPTIIDAAGITSVTLAISTLPKDDMIERSFICTIEAGAATILEAVADRPMRSTLGWLRDKPTEASRRQCEAYRIFVQQFHGWLARHGSDVVLMGARPVLGNPKMSRMVLFIALADHSR